MRSCFVGLFALSLAIAGCDRAREATTREEETVAEAVVFDAEELTLLMAEEAHDDGSTEQLTGRGFFQEDFSGLQFAIKDSQQFPDEPGNWAYFSTAIGAQESDYPETMAPLPTEACNACHEAGAADDWVFTQLYPVLRAARP